jgi:hypothetical protein
MSDTGGQVPSSEPVYSCLQVIRRKKEEISSGNKKYIESAVTAEEKSVSTAFKSLKDDLDEQDENDVGKQKAPLHYPLQSSAQSLYATLIGSPLILPRPSLFYSEDGGTRFL